MVKATYKIEKHGVYYIGVAHSPKGVFATNGKAQSYTQARKALQGLAKRYRVDLYWFDGEHICKCCA